MAAFSVNLGSCSITMAELWAIYIGLNMTSRLGVERVVVEIDSLCVTNLLRKKSLDHHSQLSLLLGQSRC